LKIDDIGIMMGSDNLGEYVFLDDRIIENNIQWLLTNGSLPVKYLTRKHIVGNSPSSRTMKDLWKEVLESPDVLEIMEKQKTDGSWFSGGSWAPPSTYLPKSGYNPYTPKRVTALWMLYLLGDMGFDITDNRVKRACEYTLLFKGSNGFFNSYFKFDPANPKEFFTVDDPPNHPCVHAFYLLVLGKVGMSKDKRLAKSYDLLIRWQREDGGWVWDLHKKKKNWTRSCPLASGSGASALYYSHDPRYEEALIRALDFQAWHLTIRKEEELRLLIYHGHNMIKELIMFTEQNVGLSTKPIQIRLNWLMDMYNPKTSHFNYQGPKPKPGNPSFYTYHLIGDDWLTYYITRIAKNLHSTDVYPVGSAFDQLE
jgi:hypothetical protein